MYGTLVPVPTLPVVFKFVQFKLNEFKVVQFTFADVKAPVAFKYEQGTVSVAFELPQFTAPEIVVFILIFKPDPDNVVSFTAPIKKLKLYAESNKLNTISSLVKLKYISNVFNT